MKYVVNSDGEIVDVLRRGDRILRCETSEAYMGLVSHKVLMGNALYASLYVDSLTYLLPRLSSTAVKVLVCCMTMLQPVTYCVMSTRDKPASASVIGKRCGISTRQIERALTELEVIGLLVCSRVGNRRKWALNPYVIRVGGRLNISVAKAFSDVSVNIVSGGRNNVLSANGERTDSEAVGRCGDDAESIPGDCGLGDQSEDSQCCSAG